MAQPAYSGADMDDERLRRVLMAQQLYPPEPVPTFPAPAAAFLDDEDYDGGGFDNRRVLVAQQPYPPEPVPTFPSPAAVLVVDEEYRGGDYEDLGASRVLVAQQPYPPEPVPTFPSPAAVLVADQLYPPEPTPTFPPSPLLLVDQPYPPEPTPTFPPPAPSVLSQDLTQDAAVSNVLIGDLVDQMALASSETTKNAGALRADNAVMSLGHADAPAPMAQLYVAAGLLVVVMGVVVQGVRRLRRTTKEDRMVDFSDSYEPFLE
ncbi:hypothetical protein Poli38472_013609 [Pythium oligandrum]|uniref:Uncharacterized protein n=1 Tax=Pythium oligandrum TaxID=41045 RepID=A0A8K1CD20_PYTOL|nr:hypothetical protein Poli38472_013609 [Pythium oligandrum]|eukprot:TMW61146.1 hypothetical protein Poli38472_013609 [Pythium oligandrum]